MHDFWTYKDHVMKHHRYFYMARTLLDLHDDEYRAWHRIEFSGHGNSNMDTQVFDVVRMVFAMERLLINEFRCYEDDAAW